MITDAMVEAAHNELHRRFFYGTDDLRVILRTALEAYERAAWQPFDTAVWDGTPFFVNVPKRGTSPEFLIIVSDAARFAEALSAVRRPTHWRPLPEPPHPAEMAPTSTPEGT